MLNKVITTNKIGRIAMNKRLLFTVGIPSIYEQSKVNIFGYGYGLRFYS